IHCHGRAAGVDRNRYSIPARRHDRKGETGARDPRMTTAAAKDAILGVVPTPPAFEVPRNACDCHTHIFGPVERFPFSSKRLYTPGDASIDDLNALHRALHIDRVV